MESVPCLHIDRPFPRSSSANKATLYFDSFYKTQHTVPIRVVSIEILHISDWIMANENVRRHLSAAELWREVCGAEDSTSCGWWRVSCGPYGCHPSLGEVIRAWFTCKTIWLWQNICDFWELRSSWHSGTKITFCNCNPTSSDLQNDSEVHVSTQTISTRLHERGMRSRRPCIRIPLSRDHCWVRYDWAMDHVGCSRMDWPPVPYTLTAQCQKPIFLKDDRKRKDYEQ
jgi:hypothetical protein